jgi:hypothetical protein
MIMVMEMGPYLHQPISAIETDETCSSYPCSVMAILLHGMHETGLQLM